MQTYPQGLAGNQLFQHTVLAAFLTVMLRAAMIVPLFTHFAHVEPSPSSHCHLSSLGRFLPISHDFSSGLLPILVSLLTYPSSSSSSISFLPASRLSPLSDTTASSRSNRFLRLTAPLPVLGFQAASTEQSLITSPLPPLPGREGAHSRRVMERADSVMNGFSCN